MQFYNPVTRSVYHTGDYKLDLGHCMNTHFGLTYDRGILVGTYTHTPTLTQKTTLQESRSTTVLPTPNQWRSQSITCHLPTHPHWHRRKTQPSWSKSNMAPSWVSHFNNSARSQSTLLHPPNHHHMIHTYLPVYDIETRRCTKKMMCGANEK